MVVMKNNIYYNNDEKNRNINMRYNNNNKLYEIRIIQNNSHLLFLIFSKSFIKCFVWSE